VAEVERALFQSAVTAVGVFRCPPHHERFRGGVVDACLAALPRTTVLIEQEGRPPVVADPNTAMIYNAFQAYRRSMIDARGDICDWVALSPSVAVEIAEGLRLGVSDDPERLFAINQAPVLPDVAFAQRYLVTVLEQRAAVDPVEVEEIAIRLFVRVLSAATPDRRGPDPARAATRRRHRDIVEDAKAYMALNLRDRLTLSDVAAAVGSSPFHLSRLFSRLTGSPLHGYLQHLRLRRGLDALAEWEGDIAGIAIGLGFSSHSHFSQRFKETFGVAPGTVRRHLASADLEEMRKIVKV
jgi:AraC-like DNA-binding protein